ncbi:MAG: cupredoxin domain-containing protein [Deltaproteobacteria bacterium]|nr:cupredoxin domain-containing protein [Deltaproteobacteria bacterium]
MKTAKWMIFGFLGLTLVAAACSSGKAEAAKTAKAGKAAHEQVVEVAVTSDGFVPATIKVRAGHPVKLVVTRKVDRTCATDIVIKSLDIKKPLPLNVPVEVTFTPKQPGKLRFACSMDMIAGEIVVE